MPAHMDTEPGVEHVYDSSGKLVRREYESDSRMLSGWGLLGLEVEDHTGLTLQMLSAF